MKDESRSKSAIVAKSANWRQHGTTLLFPRRPAVYLMFFARSAAARAGPRLSLPPPQWASLDRIFTAATVQGSRIRGTKLVALWLGGGADVCGKAQEPVGHVITGASSSKQAIPRARGINAPGT